MPFTLVGQVLRNFIFGAAMCKMIPYFQAVSVSVGVWTLVAISLERYFAICSPLKSRRWQTQFHAYKMIAVVWFASLLWSIPILAVSTLQTMKDKEKHKCREDWPSLTSERAFNLFLDATLLLIPLVIMTVAYSLIVTKLWKGMRREIQHNSSCRRQQLERTSSSGTVNEVIITNANGATAVVTPLRPNRTYAPSPVTVKCSPRDGGSHGVTSVKMWLLKGMSQVKLTKSKSVPSGMNRDKYGKLPSRSMQIPTHTLEPPETSRLITGVGGPNAETASMNDTSENNSVGEYTAIENSANMYVFNRHAIRSNNIDKSIEAKKKVIRMLFVIVAEFFVCWAPLHVVNTWYLYYPEGVYGLIGSTGISLVQLLAYISSCCNPITYCFMHRKFRQAFLSIFDCFSGRGECPTHMTVRGDPGGTGGLIANNSDISGNDSTAYAGRASAAGRSEVVVLEAEDRV